MKELQIGKKVEFAGTEITEILGGFGEGKRGILAREIAEVHGVELSGVNRNINRNRKRFKDGVDIIDLKQMPLSHLFLKSDLFTNAQFGNAKNIYLLSERGYAKLIKIMDDDISWEVHDKLVDEYFQLKQDNKRLAQDNTELHKIAVDDIELEEKRYLADKKRYGWHNIRTVLEGCDYKQIEDEVAKIIDFHTNVLKKRDRANYDSHKQANRTKYKQLVRDRVFEVLDDITNRTLDGVLRAVTGELRVDVMKNKIGTINRSNGRIQAKLEREVKAYKPPTLDQYHVAPIHPYSYNSSLCAVEGYDGKPTIVSTSGFKNWKRRFKQLDLPNEFDLNVDLTKPVRLRLAVDCLDKFDVTNFSKSAQDALFSYYGYDDKVVQSQPAIEVNEFVDEFSDGKIYFYFENTI